MRKGTRLLRRCPYCGRAFKHAGSLAKHKQICANRPSNKPVPRR